MERASEREGRLLLAARVLSLAWAAWWLFFGLASALGEGLGVLGGVLHVALPGGVCLLSALLAWRWPIPGGWLLIIEGLALAVGYPWMAWGRLGGGVILLTALLLALPPLVAGALFLWGGRRGG